MRVAPLLSLVAVTLAGCVGPTPAPVAPPRVVARPPAPIPTPAPPPRLAVDWNDWPFTPGDWRYLQQPGATIARFENLGQPILTVTCDRFTRQLRVGGLPPLPATIRTTSLTRQVASVVGTGEPALAFAANDPLLDAIAFSRGRFVIEQAGRAPLVLRPYAEIGRVIEDCRG